MRFSVRPGQNAARVRRPALLCSPLTRTMPRLHASLVIALLLTLVPVAEAAPDGVAPTAPATVRAHRNDVLAYVEALPGTNPYRATLLRLQTLPATDREALKKWTDENASLTPDQQALARELSTSLVALATQPPTRGEDWPFLRDQDDPDDPNLISVAGASLVRDLARLAAKTGDTSPPGEAIAFYTAAAQLGRQQHGVTLIDQLTGAAAEDIAISAASRRLSEFSPAELQKLSAAWSVLQPRPDNAQAFAAERDLFSDLYLNGILRPGLAAILAGDSEAGEKAARQDPDAGFTRHLRLSGLADLGDGERRISLENTATGLTFTITEGKSTEGIELVSLDFETHEAVIRRGGREAVIHLESKRIVERVNPHDAVARLRKLFASSGMPRRDDDADLLDACVERARHHPGGAGGYVDDLLVAHRHLTEAQLAFADSPDAPANPPDLSDTEEPLLKLFLPSLGSTGRTLNTFTTSATMLQAAIHQRLAQLGAASSEATPTDPWTGDGSSFSYEATPDGGFQLRSRYEVNPGKPLTYKFAAPDAGFVRKK